MSALSDADCKQIAGLTGLGAEALASAEVLGAVDETRLSFNAPTPVRYWTLRVGGWELELFHWLEQDEWELVHSSRLA